MPVDPKEKIDLGFAIDVAGLARGIKALAELQRQLVNIAAAAKGVDTVGEKFKKVRQESSAVDVAVSSLAGSMNKQFSSAKKSFDPLVSSMQGYAQSVERSNTKLGAFGAFYTKVAGAAKSGAQTMSRGWQEITSRISTAKQTLGGMASSLKAELSGIKDGVKFLGDKVSGAIGGMKNLLVAGLALAGISLSIDGIKSAFMGAFEIGKELETMTVKMTNKFGSSAFAEKATGFINDMSQEYGLSKDELGSYVDELGKAGVSLESMNFKGVLEAAMGPGQDLSTTMSAITDVAKNPGNFQAFAETFGNQIDPAAFQEAIDGATTYQERMTKISDFLGKNFEGNTDRFKDSAEGQITSLTGFFEKIKQTIASSGVFDAMKEVLGNVSKWVDQHKPAILGAAKAIGGLMGTVVKFISGLLGNLFKSANSGVGFFEGIQQKIKDIFFPLMFMLAYIGTKIGDMIGKLFKGDLSGAVTDLGDILASLIEGLGNAINWAIDMISNALGWIADQMPKLIPAVVGAVSKIVDKLVAFAQGLGKRISALWPKLLKVLSGILKMLPPIIKKLLIGVIDILKDWLPRVAIILYDTLVWAFKEIGSLGPNLGALLSDVIGYLGEWISGLMGQLLDLLMNSDNPFVRWLGSIVATVKNVFDTIIGLAQDILTYAGKILGDLGDMFYALFTGDFGGAWDAIKNLFGHIWELIVSILGRLVTLIGNQLKIIWTSITDIFGSAWEWVVDATKDFIKGIIKFFKELPGKILAFVKSIPKKVIDLLSQGLNVLDGFFEKIVDGMFGEGVFDGLKDQLNEFINFFIKKYNSLVSVVGGEPINIIVDADPAREVLKALRDDLGLQLKDATRSTDISDYVKKLSETVASSGIQGDSDQYKALETLMKQMNVLNRELGSATGDKRKGINDKLIELVTAFDTITQENLFSNQMVGKDGSAGSGDVNMIMAAVAEKFGKESYMQKKNKIFAERAAVTVPIKDGIVKDGQVTPTDPRDAIFATKQPKKAGLIQNIMSGAGDLWSGVKNMFGDVVSGGADMWSQFKQSQVGSLVSGIFDGALKGTGSISEAASSFMDKFTETFQGTKIGNPSRGNPVRGTGEFQGQQVNEKQLALLGYLDRATSGAVDDQTKQILDWCAAFVSNVYSDVFGKLSPQFFDSVIKPTISMGASDLGSRLSSKAPYFSKSKKPAPFGVFYWGKAGSGHIGMVKDYTGGSSFTSFEGNTTLGGADSRTGGSFVSKSRNIDWVLKQSGAGFANPNWDAIAQFNGGRVAKDFVMKPDGSVQLFEPTDTVFGMRNPEKMFSALLSGQTPTSTEPGAAEYNTDKSSVMNFNFGANSIVIQSSGNERIDAEKLLKEMELIQRRKMGRMGRSER